MPSSPGISSSLLCFGIGDMAGADFGLRLSLHVPCQDQAVRRSCDWCGAIWARLWAERGTSTSPTAVKTCSACYTAAAALVCVQLWQGSPCIRASK